MKKVELQHILSSYSRLTSGIFIPGLFQTIAEASSIIFDLRRQIFTDAKIFEFERLDISLDVYRKRARQHRIWMVLFTSLQISIQG